jgi:hypothetical protein
MRIGPAGCRALSGASLNAHRAPRIPALHSSSRPPMRMSASIGHALFSIDREQESDAIKHVETSLRHQNTDADGDEWNRFQRSRLGRHGRTLWYWEKIMKLHTLMILAGLSIVGASAPAIAQTSMDNDSTRMQPPTGYPNNPDGAYVDVPGDNHRDEGATGSVSASTRSVGGNAGNTSAASGGNNGTSARGNAGGSTAR